ncbi:MAG: iron ABC transporter permease [Syntrophomonas sp.]
MKKPGQTEKIVTLNLILVLLMAALFLISVSIGRYSISIPDILNVLLGQTEDMSKTIVSILINSRIPRAVGAMLVGMALSASGAAYQSVFRNPMATPDILGAASGAACGAAAGILLSLSDLGVQLTAFLMGLLAVFLTYTISKIVGRGQGTVIFLILVGMVVSALFNAVISITKYFADIDNQLPAITFWLMGGLTDLTRKDLIVVIPIILAGIILMNFLRWKLNLLSFSDEEAMAMGVDVQRMRRIIISIATFTCSAAISICGLVGWVGIVVPHCARLLVGPNYQRLLPVATLLGGIYMMLIDDLARTLLIVEIPLGILTALIGAPVFIYLLFSGDFLGGQE